MKSSAILLAACSVVLYTFAVEEARGMQSLQPEILALSESYLVDKGSFRAVSKQFYGASFALRHERLGM